MNVPFDLCKSSRINFFSVLIVNYGSFQGAGVGQKLNQMSQTLADANLVPRSKIRVRFQNAEDSQGFSYTFFLYPVTFSNVSGFIEKLKSSNLVKSFEEAQNVADEMYRNIQHVDLLIMKIYGIFSCRSLQNVPKTESGKKSGEHDDKSGEVTLKPPKKVSKTVPSWFKR